MGVWSERVRRGLRRSPGEIWRRIRFEAVAQMERYRQSPGDAFSDVAFAHAFGAGDINQLWERLADRPFPAMTSPISAEEYEAFCPGDEARMRRAASDATARVVDLLGSGPVQLATPIDWHVDFKVGQGWPVDFFRDIDIIDGRRPTDIKVPWELSRLQWLIPVAQQFLLKADEEDALFVRTILEEWMSANPYSRGVNWASTMEAAMRAMVWIWLFQVFSRTRAWHEPAFRARFLKVLYAHGVFVRRHLERFGVDGNHLTANASGLVVLGAFFDGPAGRDWEAEGWRLIEDMVPLQVPADGVCFEASAAYHRFVAELIHIAVRQRDLLNRSVAGGVRMALSKMGAFGSAYTGPDGKAPLWGDSDDGRVLPFGGQPARDHSYLPMLLVPEGSWDVRPTEAAQPEIFWWYGPEAFVSAQTSNNERASQAFEDAGVFVLRGGKDYLFVDAGSVGFAGLGGHGHNDCLSFELSLTGVKLIEDSGTYTYTSSLEDRNTFRQTAAHSTPQVDGQEQNRLPPGEPFRLNNDAQPEIRSWTPGDTLDVLTVSHNGYQRLDDPVVPVRTFCLDKGRHGVVIADQFEGAGLHAVRVPFHFAQDIAVVEGEEGCWHLTAEGADFTLVVRELDTWESDVSDGWVSPAYGIRLPRPVLAFSCDGALAPLTVGILAGVSTRSEALEWLDDIVVAGQNLT